MDVFLVASHCQDGSSPCIPPLYRLHHGNDAGVHPGSRGKSSLWASGFFLKHLPSGLMGLMYCIILLFSLVAFLALLTEISKLSVIHQRTVSTNITQAPVWFVSRYLYSIMHHPLLHRLCHGTPVIGMGGSGYFIIPAKGCRR